MKRSQFINRDISWLAFNHRVLQEAKDHRVPLYERIKFLAIFSSNLDEFFRVRVAFIRRLLALKKKTKKKLDIHPANLLDKIHDIVFRQQEEFGSILRNQIFPELSQHNIALVSEEALTDEQKKFAGSYFLEKILPRIQPIFLRDTAPPPFLQNRNIYLAVKLFSKERSGLREYIHDAVAIVEIPTDHLPRFVVLPNLSVREKNDTFSVIFLDDVMRLCLPLLFPGYDIVECYSIKLTRDAELYIDDEYSGNLVEKIKSSLKKRSTGIPSRFLYDATMPKEFLHFLRDSLLLAKKDLISGGHYHNLHDLFSFPNPGQPQLEYEPLPPLPIKELDAASTMIEAITKKDYIVHYPYQSYEYILRFLREAANDPLVTSIKITLYRVASNSLVVTSLIDAAKNEKSVTVFVEVKARFDEESNLYWAEELEKAGACVLYSFPGWKVHSKLCLVTRKEKSGEKSYAYLATGNFNEKSSRIYADHGFFTRDERLTNEVARVFDFLEHNGKDQSYDHLLVAPFNMLTRFLELIDREIDHAKKGGKASMILKMNSIEEKEVIEKLYEASNAGVKIQLIVRGICCLVPGVKGMSKNISVISIVDRYLEHARVFIFHNNGDEEYFIGSADWMIRNLKCRIEVVFPIYVLSIRLELRRIIDLQLHDNTKARRVNASLNNRHRRTKADREIRAQTDTHSMLRAMGNDE